MHSYAAAGAAFLIAVLWFDLMFDVQTMRHRGSVLPADVLDSIAAYYRRVSTDARPMGSVVSLVMLATLLAIIGEVIRGGSPSWAAWASLILTLSAVGLALSRTVRNAARLGGAKDSAEIRTTLARRVLGDHLYCLAAMASVLAVQLFAVA
jgi:hypothetical protein